MARTVEEVLRQQFGQLVLQVCGLTAEVEALREKLVSLNYPGGGGGGGMPASIEPSVASPPPNHINEAQDLSN